MAKFARFVFFSKENARLQVVLLQKGCRANFNHIHKNVSKSTKIKAKFTKQHVKEG